MPRRPKRPVHPHGRGDNAIPSKMISTASRFTPTGVGTTQMIPKPGRTCSVHPHGRGDNFADIAQELSVSGSPPRAWGQRRDVLPNMWCA